MVTMRRSGQMSSTQLGSNVEVETPSLGSREIDVDASLAQVRQLKRTLKQLSKNQLIQLVLQQVNETIEQQNINKVLLEQLKTKESANVK